MPNMLVVNIVDGKPLLQEVPEDWEKCLLTGEYRPPEEYRLPGEKAKVRSNCTATINLTFAEQEALQLKTRSVWNSEEHKRLQEMLYGSYALRDAFTKKELLQLLSELPDDAFICCSGTYEDSKLAESLSFYEVYNLEGEKVKIFNIFE